MSFVTALRPVALSLGVLVGLDVAAVAQIRALDDKSDPVVAIVDGGAIYRSDLTMMQRALPAQFQHLPLEVLYPALIERMIDAKLIFEAGRKEKLDADDEVKRRVRQFEERVVQEVYLNRMIEKQVTEESIRKKYDEFVKANPAKEEVSARHILVQTEAQAKEVIAELAKGADFAELAKTRSIDPAGKQQGGDLGFFSKEEMVPEFSEAAFKMKDGETSKAPVRSQFGFHVIRVEARRTASQPLEEVRDKLVSDMSQDIMNGAVSVLRKNAKIEVFNLDGTPAASQAPGGSVTPARPLQPRR
jgi:peptidyl-prolyl cis-trans isomerase C